MKKITQYILHLALAFIFICIGSEVQAQNYTEAITSFTSNIQVNIDNSIDVIETIIYDTGSEEHHGIYRDIYPYSSQGRKMSITNISVVDEYNDDYQFVISNDSGNIRVKIGDPDVLFSGVKTYIIKYNATKAVGQFDDFDEIYWNVTGNEWDMPIYNASATVVFPMSVIPKQNACYYGPKGSRDRCLVDTYSNNVFATNLTSTLSPYEGLTVAVGFEKGLVVPYTSTDNVLAFFQRYLGYLVGLLIFALTSFFVIRYWFRKGRDPKGTGVIVPQYDAPEGITPMEAVGLSKENISSKDLSAEIIYLATLGYIQIREIEKESIGGLFSSADYELIRLREYDDLPNEFDREIIHRIFKYRNSEDLYYLKEGVVHDVDPMHSEILKDNSVTVLDSVKFSSLKYLFGGEVQDIIKLTFSGLQAKEYYKNITGLVSKNLTTFILIFFSLWGSGFFGGFIGIFLHVNPFPVMVGIFLSFIECAIVLRFISAKTEKGVATTEHILGLKEYLEIAEKDRLIFHNAPERKPEIFEKLLPYAMALGVADIWAKEFESIYRIQPNWYVGVSGSGFSTVNFTNSLNNFSSIASSNMSAVRSSGSGGGGSSGGGGGGGGGGSW